MSDLQDDDEDFATDSDASPASSVVGPPAPAPFVGPPAPAANPAAAPPQQAMNPAVAAYLQQKQQGQAGLAAAQDQARKNQLITDLGRSFSTVAQSVPGRSAPVDTSAFDSMDKTNDAPVKNFLAQQEEAKADPTSPQSKAVQNMVSKLYPGKFSPEDLSKISAADTDSIMKPLELDQKIQERKEESESRSGDRSDKASQKTSEAQGKAYTALRKDLETFRGNQSMQQAATAVQNSDKALALVNSSPTSQNLALLADEMGKVAMGGVPGEHGVQSLAPNNLYTKVAEMKAFLTGNPTPADVSGYLKNNADYLNQVKTISQKSLHDYRTNIAKGYKSRVNPDDYAEATADYGLGGDRAPESAGGPPQAQGGSKYKPGTVVTVKGKGKFTVGADGDTLTPVPQ